MLFIERLEELLGKNNVSKNKMLIDLGIAKGAFGNWQERGTIPSGETILKIANYFGVTTDYLLGNETDDIYKQNDITFDDFTFAFYNETKDLTEADKENLLDMARIFKKRLQERQQGDDNKEGE